MVQRERGRTWVVFWELNRQGLGERLRSESIGGEGKASGRPPGSGCGHRASDGAIYHHEVWEDEAARRGQQGNWSAR